MSSVTKHIKIPRDVESNDDLDFHYLKKLGIEYIESMGGGLWTDYNDHDPGVTMLEMLCYAISDLGNRLDMPIENIIAAESGSALKNQFYDAAEMLPSSPVTPEDYRKKFLDIRGVLNCWILPYKQPLYINCQENTLSYDESSVDGLPENKIQKVTLKGLNCILVDYDDDVLEDIHHPRTKEDINLELEKIYHENRNLCEDLVEIKEVGKKNVAVCTSIELEKNADKDLAHAKILTIIEEYFTPQISYYSLKEMLDKGYRTDQIFEGPLLDNGFIDTKELIDSSLRSEVRLSDLINLIMSLDEVKLIKDISIKECGESQDSDWFICIGEGIKPVMAPTSDEDADPEDDCSLRSVFNYSKDVLPVLTNKKKVKAYIDEIKADKNSQNELAKIDARLKVKEGKFIGIGETTTIQNDFPDTYGISPFGLPNTASTERRAQAQQLKGYLIFFDQILSSYFAHLDKVRDLFAMDRGLAPTYFTQAIKDIQGFEDLVNDYPTGNDELLSDRLISFLDENIARRNEILDHLLARFAEKFSQYSFLMSELYGEAADELIIGSKEQFLKEYVELSSRRGKGFNWTINDNWDTDNVSGTQKRIARLAGVKNYLRRNLSESFVTVYEVVIGSDTVYRWKVDDTDGATVLLSTKDYPTVSDATADLYTTIYQLVNTTKISLEEAFGSTVTDEQEIDGIIIKKPNATTHGFYIFDPEIDDPAERIIGEGNGAFATQELLFDFILDVIDFAKNDFTEEGIYLIEHILLRPEPMDGTANNNAFLPICADDCEECCSADPYSFRVSIVLPGFTQRFSNPEFRHFMEVLIEGELPAHVLARICWIGDRLGTVPDEENELMLFEEAYKAFLDAKMNPDYTSELIELKDILIDLHTIYPAGRLHDCKTDEIEGKIILGRTNLGTS